MCGIIAVVSDAPVADLLVDGLHVLQHRGYDSAGIATLDASGQIIVSKKSSGDTPAQDAVVQVCEGAAARHAGHTVGLAHTRWATHGSKVDVNAHPHVDSKGRVALVHNGAIENMQELRAELVKAGVHLKSDTDTEVVVELVSRAMDKGIGLVEAVDETLSRLTGTWGMVFMSPLLPGQLVAARCGSPLSVGIDRGRMFIASDIAAFSRYTHRFVSLKDNEVVVVQKDELIMDNSRLSSRLETAPEDADGIDEKSMSPAPHAHFTLKEIYEQPQALSRSLGHGGRFSADGEARLGGLDDNKAVLGRIHNVVLAACGTSLHASMYGALFMRNLHSFRTVDVCDASEVAADTLNEADGGLIAVSQSGETKDTLRALELAKGKGLPIMSVVNAVGSSIANTTRCGAYTFAGREHGVTSTKSFVTQVTVLALVASWFSRLRDQRPQQRAELLDCVHRLPTYCGMALKTHDHMRKVAINLKDKTDMFILGKGFALPIAMEAALKFKEICYVHAEGYGAGALKHGPFALLDKGVPVIMILLDDQHQELVRIAAEQVRGRGAYTVIITDRHELARGIADEVVVIPSNGALTALMAIVPLQLLAYELALVKGINPDKPRNLTKAVTVD